MGLFQLLHLLTNQLISHKILKYLQKYHLDGISEDILKFYEKSIDWLRDEGAEIIPISLPHTKYALPAYYIIAPEQ